VQQHLRGTTAERVLSGGTKLTLELANKLEKPVFLIYDTRKERISKPDSLGLEIQALTDFLSSNKIEILNVAGPRESKEPGVYEWTLTMLRFLNRARYPQKQSRVKGGEERAEGQALGSVCKNPARIARVTKSDRAQSIVVAPMLACGRHVSASQEASAVLVPDHYPCIVT
jgi:hypothetical protein